MIQGIVAEVETQVSKYKGRGKTSKKAKRTWKNRVGFVLAAGWVDL